MKIDPSTSSYARTLALGCGNGSELTSKLVLAPDDDDDVTIVDDIKYIFRLGGCELLSSTWPRIKQRNYHTLIRLRLDYIMEKDSSEKDDDDDELIRDKLAQGPILCNPTISIASLVSSVLIFSPHHTTHSLNQHGDKEATTQMRGGQESRKTDNRLS